MSDPMPNGPVREVRRVGEAVVVEVAGDIDLRCSSEFQQVLLDALAERPPRIVVHLADVAYMDSSGVASLVKLLSRARRYETAVVLAGLTPRVQSIFEITRLTDIFDIRATMEEALS